MKTNQTRPSHVEKMVKRTRDGSQNYRKRLSQCGKKGGEATAFNNFVLSCQKAEWTKQVADDAEAHANETRIAWDDDFSP